ncbi:MAG TPA: TatD family hydrolase [Candidatus Didemnitutus sp.]|nr:TatD family hydrolase [Candidatus Didemnitutus sp.]
MGLIDTHTHLDSFARDGELAATLDRAMAQGVDAMISIGTDADDWSQYAELARTHPKRIYYTVGLHPCSVADDWPDRIGQMESFWKRSPPPVALGETGLDRFHLPKGDAEGARKLFENQQAAFSASLVLAKFLGCPVVVHSRGAFRECVEMIDASGFDWKKVVFHCFSEGPDEVRELNRRGGRASFTGIITYKTAETVRAAAVEQGLDRLMFETDAPYLAPAPHRGKPNQPAWVRHTAEYCAPLFSVTYDELARITTQNARAFFGIDGE